MPKGKGEEKEGKGGGGREGKLLHLGAAGMGESSARKSVLEACLDLGFGSKLGFGFASSTKPNFARPYLEGMGGGQRQKAKAIHLRRL